MAEYTSTHVPVSQDPDKLYAAAVRVFLKKGWNFQSRDPQARAVETDWVEQDGTYGASGSKVWLSYRVLINRDSIDVFSSCKMGGLTRRDCPTNERPPGTADKERKLVEEIINESGIVADTP